MEGQTEGELEEAPRRLLRFDDFVVDPDGRLLRRGDEPVQLTPKVFALLLALLEQPGRVVPKDELIGKVWPDSFVSDANLTQTISTLRKALGETAQDRRYVVTIPGAGYSFVAPVETVADGELQTPEQSACPAEAPQPASEPPQPRRRRRRFAVAAALVLAMAAAGIFLARLERPVRDRPIAGLPGHRLSIAILGFKNLSGRSDAQWLSTALPEMLTTELAGVKQVRVIPGESVARVRLPAEPRALDRAGLKRIEDGPRRRSARGRLIPEARPERRRPAPPRRPGAPIARRRAHRLPGGDRHRNRDLFELVSRTGGIFATRWESPGSLRNRPEPRGRCSRRARKRRASIRRALPVCAPSTPRAPATSWNGPRARIPARQSSAPLCRRPGPISARMPRRSARRGRR